MRDVAFQTYCFDRKGTNYICLYYVDGCGKCITVSGEGYIMVLRVSVLVLICILYFEITLSISIFHASAQVLF